MIRPPRARAARSAAVDASVAPCSMRCAPMLAPADLHVERDIELERRLGGIGHDSADDRRRFSRGRRALRTPARRGPARACTPSRPASVSAASIRAIARLMRSALVPWIGALIAARSAPPRIDGLGERMFGSKCVFRPNSVLCSRSGGRNSASRPCRRGYRGSARNSGR